jgi:hypothetical protein
MPYRIAGIDVHKKMLAVVVADVESDGEYQFERQRVGTSPYDLRRLADWLVEREVEEVVIKPECEGCDDRRGDGPRPCNRPRGCVSGRLQLLYFETVRRGHPRKIYRRPVAPLGGATTDCATSLPGIRPGGGPESARDYDLSVPATRSPSVFGVCCRACLST